MSYKYKNVSGLETALIGVGLVPADGEVISEKAIENPNFQYLGEVVDQPEVPVEPEQPTEPTPEEIN